MGIKILDKDCNFIAELDLYSSLEWQRSFYGVGIFTIETDYNAQYADELQKNRLVIFDGKSGIIKSISYKQDENSEKLTVKGYELKGIFKQRITIPLAGQSHQSFTTTPAETVLKEIVEQNCIDISGMEFDNLNILTDQARGTNLTLKTRYKNLSDELEKIGKIAQIGHTLDINTTTKKYDFEILETNDKSADVFFSIDYDNIESQYYNNSDLGTFNYAVVGGQGEAELRTIVETGTTDTDIEKSVFFVDARDINDTADLTARGEQKLSAVATLINFDCNINDNTFIYETDWDLGDIVTVQNKKLGITEQLQIQNISEWYMAGKPRKINVIFGEKPITIKQYVDNNTDYGIV